ncbi:MAG: hypothetical protein SGJ11_00360 [Phycisphaerae bacterium]|nr:hypothetical protein [Phycisphaerae bacterium]
MAIFLLLTLAVACIANAFIKRVSIATSLTVVIVTAANLVDETWGRTGQLGLNDFVFWVPLMILFSAIVATPVAALVGVFFLAGRCGARSCVIRENDPGITTMRTLMQSLARHL